MVSNKEIIRNFVEYGYNLNDYERVYGLLDVNYYDHSPAAARCARDAVNILEIVQSSFPDMNVQVLDLIEEKDKVVGRFKFIATHSTEYMGIKPTNKKIEWEAIEIFRLQSGKIIESWGYWPDTEILEKLKRNK